MISNLGFLITSIWNAHVWTIGHGMIILLDKVFMNHAFDTPLYELLRMVNIQLKTRESDKGYKQGMKFDVSMQMLNT